MAHELTIPPALTQPSWFRRPQDAEARADALQCLEIKPITSVKYFRRSHYGNAMPNSTYLNPGSDGSRGAEWAHRYCRPKFFRKKSQLLHDLNGSHNGTEAEFSRCFRGELFNAAPNLDQYLKMLIDNGAMIELTKDQFQKRSLQFGAEEGAGEFHINHARFVHQLYASGSANKPFRLSVPGHEFLIAFGPFSCSTLFLRNRLTLMDTCEGFNARVSAPTKTLQSLHLNYAAKERLRLEIAATFKRGI